MVEDLKDLKEAVEVVEEATKIPDPFQLLVELKRNYRQHHPEGEFLPFNIPQCPATQPHLSHPMAPVIVSLPHLHLLLLITDQLRVYRLLGVNLTSNQPSP